MSVSVLHKYNSTSGAVPTNTALKLREIGVNTADGLLFVQKTDGSIKTINPLLGPAPQVFQVTFTIPLSAYTFAVGVPGAVLGQSVHCSVSGTTANGAFADEFEMEPMAAFGMIYANGAIAFTITCTDTSLLTIGTKNILYYVG